MKELFEIPKMQEVLAKHCPDLHKDIDHVVIDNIYAAMVDFAMQYIQASVSELIINNQGLKIFKDKQENLFPNGFDSWHETHYEIVSTIEYILNDGSPHKIYDLHSKGGSGYMYEHAQELTNEFELLHKDREWDGDFLDELHNFLNSKWDE